MKNTTPHIETGINRDGTFQPQITITRYNGALEDRYKSYLQNANDGNGGDMTRGGAPLKTFDEWLDS